MNPSKHMKNAIQAYVDRVLGDEPFTSIRNQCADADCLTEKLVTHRKFRSYNLYIALFIHRFIEFVGLQMHEKYSTNKMGPDSQKMSTDADSKKMSTEPTAREIPKSQPVVVVTTQYVLLYPLTKGWHFTTYAMQTDPTNNPNAIGLCHVEIIKPDQLPKNYGNILLLTQNDNAIIIPFDRDLVEIAKAIPWHRITGRTQKPYSDVRVLSATNPMLSLLWLHAIMHMAGDDVMETMQGPIEELNGMAMYELQMADLLIPKGNIQPILMQYENERVQRLTNIASVALS